MDKTGSWYFSVLIIDDKSQYSVPVLLKIVLLQGKFSTYQSL